MVSAFLETKVLTLMIASVAIKGQYLERENPHEFELVILALFLQEKFDRLS